VAGVFYGWWVTAAFSLMVFLSTGVRFSVGPFLKPMVADLSTDRATYSLVVSLSLLLYGAFMPFTGRLVDRLGVRPVAVMGTLVFAGAVAATGLVRNLLELTLIYGVVLALGLSATGHVVGSAAVSRWFIRRRATALSVLGAASMAGMSLLVPVTMWLVLTVGWRLAYGLIGLATLVVLLPLALWVVRESPESMGLHPDGDLPGSQAAAAANVSLERLLDTRVVYLCPRLNPDGLRLLNFVSWCSAVRPPRTKPTLPGRTELAGKSAAAAVCISAISTTISSAPPVSAPARLS
jgi:MFS family permease